MTIKIGPLKIPRRELSRRLGFDAPKSKRVDRYLLEAKILKRNAVTFQLGIDEKGLDLCFRKTQFISGKVLRMHQQGKSPRIGWPDISSYNIEAGLRGRPGMGFGEFSIQDFSPVFFIPVLLYGSDRFHFSNSVKNREQKFLYSLAELVYTLEAIFGARHALKGIGGSDHLFLWIGPENVQITRDFVGSLGEILRGVDEVAGRAQTLKVF